MVIRRRMMEWRNYRRLSPELRRKYEEVKEEKGAIKFHTSFDVRSQIPDVVDLTDWKVADVKALRAMDLAHWTICAWKHKNSGAPGRI